jgi:hypothetical protein
LHALMLALACPAHPERCGSVVGGSGPPIAAFVFNQLRTTKNTRILYQTL